MTASRAITTPKNTTKLLFYSLALVVTLVVYYFVFLFLRDGKSSPWITFVVSLLWGIGGVWLLFVLASSVVDLLSEHWRTRIMPWVFAAPALFLVFYYLLIPTLRTLYLSFFNADSSEFVGLENYIYAFTSPNMLESFKNNLVWIVLGGGLSVALGLLIAALADRTNPKFETVIKSSVFLPMAISMIGAAVIWRLVYAYAPAGAPQIGLLNALVTSLGGEPQPWLTQRGINNYLLILILIWMQTGFALVVFSAAIKGIPSELLEAARIDGANEIQSFFRITVPYIQVTIISVTTTIVIFTLKVFDIVFSMTGGNFGTQVIANEQYVQMFRNFDFGRGAAIAVVLLITVLPVVYYNVRDFGKSARGF
ncbi:MAG: carbohydrate ABC transporter permease [Deinococcales bacterium]